MRRPDERVVGSAVVAQDDASEAGRRIEQLGNVIAQTNLIASNLMAARSARNVGALEPIEENFKAARQLVNGDLDQRRLRQHRRRRRKPAPPPTRCSARPMPCARRPDTCAAIPRDGQFATGGDPAAGSATARCRISAGAAASIPLSRNGRRQTDAHDD
jgi:hypothetical protein